jgi:hypothetical protein
MSQLFDFEKFKKIKTGQRSQGDFFCAKAKPNKRYSALFLNPLLNQQLNPLFYIFCTIISNYYKFDRRLLGHPGLSNKP